MTNAAARLELSKAWTLQCQQPPKVILPMCKLHLCTSHTAPHTRALTGSAGWKAQHITHASTSISRSGRPLLLLLSLLLWVLFVPVVVVVPRRARFQVAIAPGVQHQLLMSYLWFVSVVVCKTQVVLLVSFIQDDMA